MTQILSLGAGLGVVVASVVWVWLALGREARAYDARLTVLSAAAGVVWP